MDLTLRQKIGQIMLMLPNRKKELELGGGSLKGFFDRYPVSGFFMGWKLWDGVAWDDRVTHLQQSAAEYQAVSSVPLIFQEDYESGLDLPGMTAFPNEMTIGAARSPELAYRYGQAVARECRSVGIRWVLHPVADLNLNPLNPLTNVRSLTDDPDLAIELLTRQIAGLQDNGVAATIKHFPGDGVDSRDQHLMTTCNSLSLVQWWQNHGKVFQALIDAGTACIMPGHITLPAYQKERTNGFPLPATLSKELLTDLLKGEMGFAGVIVSDAMTMAGFRGWYDDPLEGEIQSFLAGVDLMLWPSYEFLDEVERRVLDGRIPLARLDDAVNRVLALKTRFGVLDRDHALLRPLTAAEKVENRNTAVAVASQAVTLLRDRRQALPLNPAKDRKILVVGVTPLSRKGGSGPLAQLRHFSETLAQAGFEVEFQHNILYETQGWEDDSPRRYDRIIVAVARSPHHPFGPLGLWDDEAQSVWAINSFPKDKVIVVSFGSPYLCDEFFERVDTCINAYSNTPLMHLAVTAALTGKAGFPGVSPVKLKERTR